MATERKSIPKGIRFEVFKRDLFKCQYCGAAAPEVLLHIDHIKPVVDGGTNDITNLITACVPCNLGKGAKRLDDNTAVSKARTQMEELQERREQLEMMMAWQEGLRDLDAEKVERLADYWKNLVPGYYLNDQGKQSLKKWLKRFPLELVTQAMSSTTAQYLVIADGGKATQESVEMAFDKVPSFCVVNSEDPDTRQLYYIRGILRNNCPYYFENAEALRLLKAARSWGVPIAELRDIAVSSRSWTRFVDQIIESIEDWKKLSGRSQ